VECSCRTPGGGAAEAGLGIGQQSPLGTDWGNHGFYGLEDSYLVNRKLPRDICAITDLRE